MNTMKTTWLDYMALFWATWLSDGPAVTPALPQADPRGDPGVSTRIVNIPARPATGTDSAPREARSNRNQKRSNIHSTRS